MNSTASIGKRSDRELLTNFVNSGDRSALTEMVRRYEGLVWSVCSRSLNNRCDSEDAFQSTFLLLTTNAHRIRNRDSLSHWLYGVARKTCSQIRRRRVREPFVGTAVEDRADEEQTALEALTKQYEIDLVDQQLEKMSPRHRTPLVLFYFTGLSVKQIANHLNLSVAAVEGRLRRGRARLQRKLVAAGLETERTTLSAVLVPALFVTPGLLAKTGEGCLAAFASSKIGIAKMTITTGTKIMICKGICVAGISSILAICGLAHSGAFETSSTQTSVAEVNLQDSAEVNQNSSTVKIDLQGADRPADSEPMTTIEIRKENFFSSTHDVFVVDENNEDTVFEEVDDHVGGIHDWLHNHVMEFFGLVGEDVEEEDFLETDSPN